MTQIHLTHYIVVVFSTPPVNLVFLYTLKLKLIELGLLCNFMGPPLRGREGQYTP